MSDIKEQIRQNLLRRGGSISPIDKKPPDAITAALLSATATDSMPPHTYLADKVTAQAGNNNSRSGGAPVTGKHKESPGLKISTTKHLHQNIVAGGQHSAPQQHPIAPRPSLLANGVGPGGSSSAPNTPTADHHISTLSPSLSHSDIAQRSDSLQSISSQLNATYETKDGFDTYIPATSFSFQVNTEWFYSHVIADYKSKSPAERWHKEANSAIYELVQNAPQFPKWISIAIREKQCYWGVRPGPKSENGKRHWYVKFTCRPNCQNSYQLYGSHTAYESNDATMTVYLEFTNGQCVHKAGEKPRKRVKPNRRRGEGPFGSTGFKDDPISPTSTVASPTSPMTLTPLTPTNKRALPLINTTSLPLYGAASSPKKMRPTSPPPSQTPNTAGTSSGSSEEDTHSTLCTFIFNLFDSGRLEEHEAKLLSNLAVEKNAALMTIYRGGMQQEDDTKRVRQFLFGVRAKFNQVGIYVLWRVNF
ncbi:hypothetical protein BC938DRAFT_480709 [Jimgerdemannia flammicorona]|uniref:Uncharacterized protein n=1 Tax=Jimgerdemannia flammicorona TaxID=994334 RepID=A0A433QI19_9FUNG|nr:hypothetical protein BC938DRAFT_480709 [Jimgerdemannia flammicorona]